MLTEATRPQPFGRGSELIVLEEPGVGHEVAGHGPSEGDEVLTVLGLPRKEETPRAVVTTLLGALLSTLCD